MASRSPTRASPATPRGWAAKVARDTLVIADEAHHLGEELAWGTSFQQAFAAAPRWLLLSGTPFRSDATPIPGVRYDADGLAVPDVSYTYAEAVADGVCRPVAFVTYDGTLSWRSGEDVIESTFETVLTAREASRRYRTAISTELPDGLPRILREADAKLRALRAGRPPRRRRPRRRRRLRARAPDRQAAARGDRARAGRGAAHRGRRRPRKLAEFRSSREPWIVAVNMVSEGVDIPRLRVGVYATAAKTPLIFRQIVGRFVRTIPGAGRRSRAGCTSPPTRPCATTPPRSSRSCATRSAAPSPRRASRSPRERRASEPSPSAGVRAAERRVRPADDPVRRRPSVPPLPPSPATPHRRHRAPRAGPGRRVRAPRRPAPGAPPPRGRAPPPRRAQPPRDQRLGQPRHRRRARRGASIEQLERSIEALVTRAHAQQPAFSGQVDGGRARPSRRLRPAAVTRAADGGRTRDLELGKVPAMLTIWPANQHLLV